MAFEVSVVCLFVSQTNFKWKNLNGKDAEILPLICVYLHMTENVCFMSELFVANIALELWIDIVNVKMSLKAFEYLATNLTHFPNFFLFFFSFRIFLRTTTTVIVIMCENLFACIFIIMTVIHPFILLRSFRFCFPRLFTQFFSLRLPRFIRVWFYVRFQFVWLVVIILQ